VTNRAHGYVIHGLVKKYVENCKRSKGNIVSRWRIWESNVEIDLKLERRCGYNVRMRCVQIFTYWTVRKWSLLYVKIHYFHFLGAQELYSGLGLLIVEVWNHTQLYRINSVRLLWTRNRHVVEPVPVNIKTFTRDRHWLLRRDSNSQS